MAKVDFEFHKEGNGTDHHTLFVNQIRTKCPEYEPNVADCLANGINIQEMEFYTYALFELYNTNNPFTHSFNGFAHLASLMAGGLKAFFSFAQTVEFNNAGNSTEYIKYAGCGVSLVVSNKIFNLTNADYIRIPEKPGRPKKGVLAGQNKTLDFEYVGSDSKRLLRVECKGKEGIDGSIQSKIDDIAAKKIAQPAGVRDFSFGIVALIPVNPDTRLAKCILVDPDIPDFNEDPVNFRLSARLRYYANRFSNLGNSKWVQNIKQLFLNSNTREYSDTLTNTGSIDDKQLLSTFIQLKTSRSIANGYYFKCTVIRTEQGKIVARVSRTKGKAYFFYGFIEQLFDKIQYGTITDFLEYKSKTTVLKWNDSMWIWDEYNAKEEVFLTGELFVTDTGEVSGILNAENHL